MKTLKAHHQIDNRNRPMGLSADAIAVECQSTRSILLFSLFFLSFFINVKTGFCILISYLSIFFFASSCRKEWEYSVCYLPCWIIHGNNPWEKRREPSSVVVPLIWDAERESVCLMWKSDFISVSIERIWRGYRAATWRRRDPSSHWELNDCRLTYWLSDSSYTFRPFLSRHDTIRHIKNPNRPRNSQ